jgi:hypothetical protein
MEAFGDQLAGYGGTTALLKASDGGARPGLSGHPSVRLVQAGESGEPQSFGLAEAVALVNAAAVAAAAELGIAGDVQAAEGPMCPGPRPMTVAGTPPSSCAPGSGSASPKPAAATRPTHPARHHPHRSHHAPGPGTPRRRPHPRQCADHLGLPGNRGQSIRPLASGAVDRVRSYRTQPSAVKQLCPGQNHKIPTGTKGAGVNQGAKLRPEALATQPPGICLGLWLNVLPSTAL